MKAWLVFVILAVAFGALPAELNAQSVVLYASIGGPDHSSEPGAILTIDQATGAGTVIGTPISGIGIPGVAINSVGRMFGVTSRHLGNARLIEIDRNSGSLLADIGELLYQGNPVAVVDLGFQPGTDLLFGTVEGGVGLTQNDLVIIDTANAVLTLVGSTIDDCGFLAIAFAPNGVLYGHEANCNVLYTINPATGQILSSTGTTIPNDSGTLSLSVRPTDGMLFLSECCNATLAHNIYMLDPATGVATLLGSAGDTRTVNDLAFHAAANNPDIPDNSVPGVPTLDEWGLTIGALALLLGGTWTIHRRHANAAG